MSEEQCEELVPIYLGYYFKKLLVKLDKSRFYAANIESEWRLLFPFAWADFHRFLKGWIPSHWKINDYSEKITQEVVESFL